MNSINSLYVHIPFCERKCEYCDFTSIAGRRGETEYMHALCAEVRELGRRFPGTRLQTIFVGGGTPSLVEPAHLAALLQSITGAFMTSGDAEITMEANPSSTSFGRAQQWRAAGFNRVSLGVQSLHPDTLRFLGRVHDSQRATEAVHEVQEAGFENVNCDLIYAVPHLNDGNWGETLERVIAAGPSHVSCYELTVESGTPLHRSVLRGAVQPVRSEAALRQHEIAKERLAVAGYSQYEVSNFARSGNLCRHNLVYWRNGFYLAAGVGAHGHVPAEAASRLGLAAVADAAAVRYWHGRGIASFARRASAGELPIQGHEGVTQAQRETERIMLGLRLHEGIRLQEQAGSDELTSLRRAGFVELRHDRVRVTPRGERVLNAVALRLAAAAA